jgi:ribosomal 30S subunit maturation factor RimM
MKNLLMAAALGATALVPVTALAQTQPAQPMQQQQMTQQPGQMQDAQIEQMAVSDLMNREVVSEQGQPVGTVAGIVQQEGAEPLLVIEMLQDQTQVLLPMDRVSMRDQQIVAEGMQDGQLTGAQQFGQEQQAQFQPVDEQQQVPVRTQQAQVQQQPMQQQTTTTAPVVGTQQQATQQPMQQPMQQQMATQEQLELQGGFVVRQGPNQILGSNLMSANVIGATGENIGSVDDVLMDGEGRVMAIIVGVGGFLGIGQRDVAIPVDALNFVTAEVVAAGTPAQPTATGTVGQPAATAPGQPATAPGAAPGTVAPGTAPGTTAQQQPRDTATTGTGWGWGGDDVLQHIEVAYTREQLEDAPEFARLGERR